MELFRPVKLECFQLIQEFTKTYMSQFNSETFYAIRMPVPQEMRNSINDEFSSYGLSNIGDFLAFKRKTIKISGDACHIDIESKTNTMFNASIVFPVSGCDNTAQFWYDGQYNLTNMEYSINDGLIKTTSTYYGLDWVSEPVFADQVEIKDSPVLCRVNKPHSAFSNGIDYRITCTLRFKNNETYEELCAKLPQ